ncbi:MAG: translation initiation inhibitor [Paludibacteraceae bacterium]|nr:translation initiation inhibitor [Paludibacteraceae bacterium]
MKHERRIFDDSNKIEANISSIALPKTLPESGSFAENAGRNRSIIHSTFVPTSDKCGDVAMQVDSIRQAIEQIEKETGTIAFFVRFHLSDIATQANCVKEAFAGKKCAVSIVGQPPMPLSKVQAIAMFESDIEISAVDANTIKVSNGSEDCYWTTRLVDPHDDSYKQTHHQLQQYEKFLADNGMNIADNCVRTWFFVRDIDRNYGGVVVGRRENFLLNGLTPDTHYIASTGIEGKHEDHNVLSVLDAYAVKGISPDKMQILYAAENMNKTIEYGVTFERGVCVHHSAGYKQVYISGTASIDTKGEVLHVGDIKGQVRRMTENVGALLKEAGCNWNDISQATVYLRDIADYECAYNELSKILTDKQFIVVQAPVCRPAWLIEMEAIAIGKE